MTSETRFFPTVVKLGTCKRVGISLSKHTHTDRVCGVCVVCVYMCGVYMCGVWDI